MRNALLRVRDPDAAEEIVQETFLSALKAREQFSGHSSERTWLMGILKHKVIDHYRQALRAKPIDSTPLPAETEQPFADSGEWIGHWRIPEKLGPVDWGPTPLKDLETKELHQVLQTCLDGLPDRFRQAFVMREIDGIESEKVCQELNITQTNFWVIMHRSRLQLRRCIEKKWGAPRGKRISQ